MTDYWKSNPRHFCDVCKCWFGENNISVSMHENGRRHKGNVEKMLRETRSKAARREKDEIRTSSMLEKIERDALKAYTKDLEVSVGLPMQKSAQDALLRAELEREQEKEQIKQQLMYHSMELANKAKEAKKKGKTANNDISGSASSQPSAAVSSSQEVVVSPPISPPWQQMISPEGYPYYYNSSTGVTQWELPSDQNPPTSSLSSIITAPPPVTVTTSTHSTASSTSIQHTAISIIGLKRSSEDRGDANQTSLEPPSAKLASPYGSWTTVAVRPQEMIASEEEEEEEKDEYNDGQEGSTSDNEGKRNKFKEKTAPLPSGSPEPQVTPGAFKGFSFKKRTSTNKPQIRQRTSDFS